MRTTTVLSPIIAAAFCAFALSAPAQAPLPFTSPDGGGAGSPGPTVLQKANAQLQMQEREIAREREHRQAKEGANPAVTLTQCDQGGCWDSAGNRYVRGAGGEMHRFDGARCTQTGQRMQCP